MTLKCVATPATHLPIELHLYENLSFAKAEMDLPRLSIMIRVLWDRKKLPMNLPGKHILV